MVCLYQTLLSNKRPLSFRRLAPLSLPPHDNYFKIRTANFELISRTARFGNTGITTSICQETRVGKG